MKRREKLKVCKLNLHDITVNIGRFSSINNKCCKIIVSMNAVITDSDYALEINKRISNALSFDNVKVITSFDLNTITGEYTITVEYNDYSNSEFASLDAFTVLEGDDNILYFKNAIDVFIKD